MPQNRPLDCFEHVVVVMFENRSFDNLLGYLYPRKLPDGRRFRGLEGAGWANPIPPDALKPDPPTDGDTETSIVAKKRFTSYHSPYPDPGEDYPHVNTQLWNTRNDNFNLPPAPLPETNRLGFVNDYVHNYPAAAAGGPDCKPTYEQYRVIMDSYPPERVPVLSTLAREFAVFDDWHCSVPSQTWCNRAFWHAATSYGQVINGPSLRWFCGSRAPNLFTRLSHKFGDPASHRHPARRSPWKIYSARWNFVSLTFLLHMRALFRYDDHEHITDLERFFEDCANGELPRYSFLEPQFLFQHNDMHPSSIKGEVDGRTHLGSVLLGEHLLWRIYEAIRCSSSERGSNAGNTLLIITCDEHGGCFDHAAPHAAVPPSGSPRPGQDGFTFDRLGLRVPMVMVSGHIRPGTIISDPYDHTSFLRTMEEKWQLEPLTARDRAAEPFTAVLDADDPRPAAEWPRLDEPQLDAGWEEHAGFHEEGIHGMQRDLLHGAAAVHGVPRHQVERVETLGEAHRLMRRHVESRRPKRGPARVFLSLLLR